MSAECTFAEAMLRKRFLMPKLVDRNPESAPADRYIDTHCIDCAASRQIAPGLVIRPHGKSVQQPKPSGRMVIPAGLPEAELTPNSGTAS